MRLAVAHVQQSVAAELSGVGVTGEVHALQVRNLVAAQPPGVGSLEQHGVAHRRQPALAAQRPGPCHLGVGAVEERLQFGPGECPLARVLLVVLGVGGGVRLEADLGGVGPEVLLADTVPAVGGFDEVGAEQPQGVLVCPDRGLAQRVLGPQVSEKFVDVLHGRAPRHLVGEPQEAADQLLAALDCGEREIACQLLAAPAGQHFLQHLICGLQVANTRQLDDSPHVVNSHSPAPQVRSSDDRN